MIRWCRGDLFGSGADTLVDAVNCEGVSGAGIALAFKQRFPETEKLYQAACRRGDLRPGQVLVLPVRDRIAISPVRTIVFFPTKDTWRLPSLLGWIDEGLAALAARIAAARPDRRPRILALPALGCNLGGLSWADVRPLVEAHLGTLAGLEVLAYEPGEAKRAPAARPRTPRRA